MYKYLFSDAPRVTLHLGNALDPNKIQEGADAYFDCEIEANPKIYSVKWNHEVIWIHVFCVYAVL